MRVSLIGSQGSRPSHSPWLTSEELGGLCRVWEASVATVTAAWQRVGERGEDERKALDKVSARRDGLLSVCER